MTFILIDSKLYSIQLIIRISKNKGEDTRNIKNYEKETKIRKKILIKNKCEDTMKKEKGRKTTKNKRENTKLPKNEKEDTGCPNKHGNSVTN